DQEVIVLDHRQGADIFIRHHARGEDYRGGAADATRVWGHHVSNGLSHRVSSLCGSPRTWDSLRGSARNAPASGRGRNRLREDVGTGSTETSGDTKETRR